MYTKECYVTEQWNMAYIKSKNIMPPIELLILNFLTMHHTVVLKLYLALSFVLTKVNMVLGDKIGVSMLMNFREMKSKCMLDNVKLFKSWWELWEIHHQWSEIPLNWQHTVLFQGCILTVMALLLWFRFFAKICLEYKLLV